MIFMYLFSGIILMVSVLIGIKILSMWGGEIGKRPKYLKELKKEDKIREGRISKIEKMVLKFKEWMEEDEEERKK